ncbi:MAG: hypothetical protein KKA05_10380 [Alphaproteobacteria bacterium]|nr:hypothetical protein [Alphaproteobacteria bacterium]
MAGLKLTDMTDLERRILSYLDQHGPTHRGDVVAALAGPDSRVAKGISNGSNGAVPLIMGKWCRRLIKAGYVAQVQTISGFYGHHMITDAGKRAMRPLTAPVTG